MKTIINDVILSYSGIHKTSDGWIQYNGSQYFLNDDLLPMEDARSFCKKNHADLVVISGQTERNFYGNRYFLKISRLLIIFLFDIDGCLDQCFFKPVRRPPSLHILCVSLI